MSNSCHAATASDKQLTGPAARTATRKTNYPVIGRELKYKRRKQNEEYSARYSDLILPNLNTVIVYLIAVIVVQ